MVRQAPTFEELASQINAFCQGRVFVAHSVNFDYPIVKREFERCGLVFSRKKLCTVRLSRKVFPGLRSYSLGKLCSSLQIPLKDRHRAAGDARATALLLHHILEQPQGSGTIKHFLNARSQEGTLPPHLPKASFERIPSSPGIYYFKDASGKVIYVGKAINLKKRVLGHFYDASQRERDLCRETRAIDFEPSGSELLALLMEAVAIKKHFPKYNRAQKRIRPALGLFSYADRDGIRHLAVNRLRKGQQALKVFYNATEARLYLEQVCTEHGLCAKYCHLQEGVSHCGHFRVPECSGICRGRESVKAYNDKVRNAEKSIKEQSENLLISEKGRTKGEKALIWVSKGVYRGYGFVSDSSEPGEALDQIQVQPHYPETDRILQAYMVRHPEHLIRLEQEVWQKAGIRQGKQELMLF